MERALNNRPELQSLNDQKKQTQSLIKIAQGGWLPTVGLFANYQWNRGQDMPPNDTKWEPGYQYGVNASVPIFDGFQAYGETQAAKGQYIQVTWGEQALRNGIRTEVSADYLQLLTAKESVDAEKTNVAAAEKNYDAAEKRYREGYVNQLDVLDAEINLTSARAGYLGAISNYLTAKAALEKAMGLEV
jgi:outer membrane protein TolC